MIENFINNLINEAIKALPYVFLFVLFFSNLKIHISIQKELYNDYLHKFSLRNFLAFIGFNMYKFFHNIFEKKREERNDDWADYEKRNYKDLNSEDLNQFKIGITMPILLVIILLFIIISVLDSFMF